MKKIVLYSLAGLLVLLVAAVLVGPSFVDWNAHKGRVLTAIQDRTGRAAAPAGEEPGYVSASGGFVREGVVDLDYYNSSAALVGTVAANDNTDATYGEVVPVPAKVGICGTAEGVVDPVRQAAAGQCAELKAGARRGSGNHRRHLGAAWRQAAGGDPHRRDRQAASGLNPRGPLFYDRRGRRKPGGEDHDRSHYGTVGGAGHRPDRRLHHRLRSVRRPARHRPAHRAVDCQSAGLHVLRMPG